MLRGGFAAGRGLGGVEKGAGVLDRVVEGGVAEAPADQVEEVAALSGVGVGPAAGTAGRVEAHPQRASLGAVEVADEPVAALAVAVGQVAAAQRRGAFGERGGDIPCGPGVFGGAGSGVGVVHGGLSGKRAGWWAGARWGWSRAAGYPAGGTPMAGVVGARWAMSLGSARQRSRAVTRRCGMWGRSPS